MSRQPFKLFAAGNPGGHIEIGTQSLATRPELLALIARCLTTWPNVEAEMALLLGQLLGATNAATMAVFQTLRKSSTQREAILEAGRLVLSEAADRELLLAILNVHKSVEKERNALAHGHFGTYDKMPDGILWMNTANYIDVKAVVVLIGDATYDEVKRNKLYSCLWYYKVPHLQSILDEIDDLGWIGSDLIRYFRTPPIAARAAQYRELSIRPRIAQEVEKLRRAKKPST